MEEVKLAIQRLLTATHNDAMNDGRSKEWREAKAEARSALENLFSTLMSQLDYYKADLDKIRGVVGAKEDQSTTEAVEEMAEDDSKDVHTEHCCYRHGCKYGDASCSVETGDKEQSHPCEQCCEEAADPVRSALQAFVDDFEVDDMWRDEEPEEPDPNWCWNRLSVLHKRAKKALEDS